MTTPLFADDFAGDGPIDSAKWASSGIVRAAGVAAITAVNATASLTQVAVFDVRGKTVTVQVQPVPVGGNVSVDLRSSADASQLLSVRVSGGQLSALLAPETGVVKRVPYSPTDHGWVQFIERAGNVTWAVGPTQNGPWPVLRSTATPTWAPSSRLVLTGALTPSIVIIDGGSSPTASQLDLAIDGGAQNTITFADVVDGGAP